MALKTARTSLQFVVRLGLVWYCGMVSRTAGTSTFPDTYEGIHSRPGAPTSRVTCNSPDIYSTWGKWASCCARGEPDCEFVTKCDGGTLSGIFGGTGHCDSYLPNCYTMTIFDSYPSPSNSWVEVGCATGWTAFTIYREFAASATSTTSTSITSLSASTSEPSLTSIVTTSTSSPIVTTSTSSPPPPAPTEDPEPSSSKAWIAGPVAGGIAALLLLGALFFWWRRRKNAQNSVETPSMTQTGTASGYQPEYVGNPHGNNYTPQLHSPSSPPAAPYYPPNSPPHYGSNSPGLHDASNASQYTYVASGTPYTMSWQGSPRPVSEQDPMGMQHKHFVAEAP